MRFAFGDLELDTTTFELRRSGTRVPLEPQAFDVLVHLVQHRDRVVSKVELMDEVWGGRFVTETAVTSRIKQVRRAVGDDGEAQRVILTVHGRGYRFVAPAVQRDDAVQEPSGAATPVRYTASDGLQIAYQVTGDGEVDILLVAGFVSHLEQDWGDPRHAHFLERLGSLGRLIRFDKRGTGMSDRPPGIPDLETRIHDVLAVLDAAGSQRAVLLGYSEGGPMAVLFAATQPERVSSLVLVGSYARRLRAPDYPWGEVPEERRGYTEHLVSTWDWEADMRLRCPSADDAMTAWWARRSRAATTPSTLRALMEMNGLVDVRDALPAVRVPTLVLHRRGDQMVRVDEGRFLAERIPGARFVELSGEDHFVSGAPDQLLDPVEAFLASRPEPGATSLALAAVVAAAGADADELVVRLAEAGGRLRGAPGGRRVLLFDGPAKATRSGVHHVAGVVDGSLGVSVAEVDRDRPDLEGTGVLTAQALAEAAPPGSVWATSTVRDLLSGTDVALTPMGVVDLGSTGRREVFAAVPASTPPSTQVARDREG